MYAKPRKPMQVKSDSNSRTIETSGMKDTFALFVDKLSTGQLNIPYCFKYSIDIHINHREQSASKGLIIR